MGADHGAAICTGELRDRHLVRSGGGHGADGRRWPVQPSQRPPSPATSILSSSALTISAVCMASRMGSAPRGRCGRNADRFLQRSGQPMARATRNSPKLGAEAPGPRESARHDATPVQRRQSGSWRIGLYIPVVDPISDGAHRNWVHGNFDADWPGLEPPPKPFDQIPVAVSPMHCVRPLSKPASVAPSSRDRGHIRHRPPRHLSPGAAICGGISGSTSTTRRASSRRRWRCPGRRTTPIAPTSGGRRNVPYACTTGWPDTRSQVGSRHRRVGQNAHLNMVARWPKLGFVTRDAKTGKF